MKDPKYRIGDQVLDDSPNQHFGTRLIKIETCFYNKPYDSWIYNGCVEEKFIIKKILN